MSNDVGTISLSTGARYFVINNLRDPSLISLVRGLPEIKAGKQEYSESWLMPVNKLSADHVARLAREFDFYLSSEISAYIAVRGQSVKSTDGQRIATTNPPAISALALELRSYQREAVQFGLKHERIIIGDEMGVGKSGEALATMHAAKAFPVLIVCPMTLKTNWEREIGKWMPMRIVYIVNGTQVSQLPAADFVIINYDLLRYWNIKLAEMCFQGIIIDEAHMIKERQSMRSKLVISLASKIRYRLALTGTPVINKPEDMIALLHAVGRLDELGGRQQFVKRFCEPSSRHPRLRQPKQKVARSEDLNTILRKSIYIRRTKDEVLRDLPEKRRTILRVSPSNSQKYHALEEDSIQELRGLVGQSKSSRQKEARILFILEKLRQESAWGKLSVASQWIADFLETGEKLVVFAHHKAIIADLVNQLASVCRVECITGDTSQRDRQDAIDRFQNDPDVRLIVCNIRAAGLGVDLTAASNILFVELDWTAAAHDQGEDRCHRFGQSNPVNAWYMLCRDTIDERIYNLIEKKRRIAKEIADGEGERDDISVIKELVQELIN